MRSKGDLVSIWIIVCPVVISGATTGVADMMEVVTGYARDVIALIWHDMLSENDIRASLTPTERDARAGKHNFRLLAKMKALDVADPGEFRRTEPNAGADQWPEVGRIAIITDDVLSRHAVQFFAPFFHTPV